MRQEKDEFIEELKVKVYDKQFKEAEQIIFDKFGYNIEMLKIPSHSQRIVYIRMIFSYICVRKGIPITIIGKKLGKTHSSISVYISNFDVYYKSDKLFKILVDSINNYN